MAMEKLTKDMNIIANLDAEPNDVGGLTAAELQAKFDEGGIALKAYLNDVLIPALEALGVEQAVLAPEGAGFKYLRLDSNQVLEFSDDGETWRTTASQIVDGDGNELGYGAYVSAEDRERWNAKQPAIPGTAGQVPVFGEDGSLRGADQVRPETAALYGLGAEAVPDDVLAVLSKAALLKQVGNQPIYQEVTVDISALAVGATARIPVNGAIVEYWVAAKDYEAALNGPGRTLLVGKDGVNLMAYSADSSYYPGSNPDTYLEDTYKPQIREDVREEIGLTSIKVKTYSSNDITIVPRGVFLLSYTEYGRGSYGDGAALQYASSRHPTLRCWTRTPKSISAIFTLSKSQYGDDGYSTLRYIAPAFTLPNDFTYTIYTDGRGNYFPEQAYTPGQHVLVDVLGNDTDTPKIMLGSYTGTGTFGIDNPCILTFEYAPFIVCIYEIDGKNPPFPLSVGSYSEQASYILLMERVGTEYGVPSFGLNTVCKKSTDGKTIQWYGTSSNATYAINHQFNRDKIRYAYIAIGY